MVFRSAVLDFLVIKVIIKLEPTLPSAIICLSRHGEATGLGHSCLVTILPQNLAFATRLFKQDSLKKLSFKRVSLASLKLQCNFYGSHVRAKTLFRATSIDKAGFS